MTGDEGKEVIGSAQYCAVNKSPCGKASMIGHEGKQVTGRDVRWSKFVGTGKERNAFFPVSFPFLFFPAHFRAHLYCQLQTVVTRLILVWIQTLQDTTDA